MNRYCLNCGEPDQGGICTGCGLDSASAVQALRRRLLQRLAIFLLGAIAFFPVVSYYPPLDLDLILIFLGVVFFFALLLAIWLDRRARTASDLEIPKRVFFALVPVPWLIAGLLFVNGRFDSSPRLDQPATVIGKFAMPGVLRNSRVIVNSWRPGQTVERVPIPRDEYERFTVGDKVVIRYSEGLAGIPWVYGVFRE